ncbi:MAG: response regulator [Desulfobulbaceae bacterium]|nr:response regulator [Desulfobulbaceae bacterium]
MPNSRLFTVLIVEDTEMNIDILIEALGNDYQLRVATDGESALKNVALGLPDLILLDIMMPGMDGYEVLKRLKADMRTSKVPVIFLTAMTGEHDEAKGLALGAIDYITKPFNPDLVKARVANHLMLKNYQDNLESLVEDRTRELRLTQEAIIHSMGVLAEYRDPETGGHIKRTQHYVRTLALQVMGHVRFQELDQTTIDIFYKCAPLHDIGKIAISDKILLKPGKLTPEEFAEMQKHCVYGRDAIIHCEKHIPGTSFLKHARELAYSHHEKWDGSGYPEGIAGENIPTSGRIMAVADVYDALISKRVYKPPFPHPKAVDIIKQGKGSHFDPDLVDAFVAVEDQCRRIALEFADFEEEKAALRGDDIEQ